MGAYRLKQRVWAAFLYTGKKYAFLVCLLGDVVCTSLNLSRSSGVLFVKQKEHILPESIVM